MSVEKRELKEETYVAYCFQCNKTLCSGVDHDVALLNSLNHQDETGHSVVMQLSDDMRTSRLVSVIDRQYPPDGGYDGSYPT